MIIKICETTKNKDAECYVFEIAVDEDDKKTIFITIKSIIRHNTIILKTNLK
jgi:hypothetical protein